MYSKYKVHLTDSQLQKLKQSHKSKRDISVRIDPSLPGNFDLYLTKTQIEELKRGRPKDLKLSKAQLIKNGGFIISIPLLLAGISAAASVAGAASGIAKTMQAKSYEKDMVAEAKRHNAKMETLSKKGMGAFLPKKHWREA